MLFLSIAEIKAAEMLYDLVDGLELRLDLYPSWDIPLLRRLISQSPYKIMVTLRGQADQKHSVLRSLLQLNPSFCDLDYKMDAHLLNPLLQDHPDVAFVLSYHASGHTPLNLDTLYESMHRYPAFCYKIAAMVHSTNDALQLLLFARKHPRVSAICMGESGSFARILGPVVSNPVNYACVDHTQHTAPGQLTLSELQHIYQYSSLNHDTALYGLIGDPVTHSQGHLYHNRIFQEKGLNAVYVKMCVKQEELPLFFDLAQELGFQGLSVTMPLKEHVLPFIDHIDDMTHKIGAANTLRIRHGKIWGTNTDGIGALNAVEKKMSVDNKRVLVIGAGGAGRAIAYEAVQRGADVHIASRNGAKAQQLAASLNCTGSDLSSLPHHYDIIIHCAPHSSIDILPGCLAMDSVYTPRDTPFIQQAQSKGCTIVYGEEMFFNQAALQTIFWMS